ncbi:PREDICTED: zinc finger protein 774-like, partial [Chaetura pelagica]|uniref:zinc finger protein 774-like n=1 Tax=Chaetura pelagica TaxID=8897 RepID=UPI000523B78B
GSTVHIKQEEELCSAHQQEGEAGEAPGEPCPAEETFYEPEASSQARNSQEVDPRELPGMESQDFPRDPDTGFQAYATDVLSWIKQEEEPRCPEQDLEKEEISADSSTAEETFYEPEASSQARNSQEVDPRELPGMESQDFPRDPDTGFQAYATDVLSWIKQEEEPRCPEQDLEKEEISADSSTVHDANPRRDPPADAFESTVGDSEPPGRAAEKFSKDPSPGVTWDTQWNPEMMETSSLGGGLGGEPRHERGFAEPLDFFSAQESSVGRRPCAPSRCEEPSSQQEHLQAAQRAREGLFPGLSCDRNPSDRLFQLLPAEPGAAPGPCQGLPPPVGSPCWEQAERARGCGQSQPRGKSYICSDCGKSFVCHSWLVRHQMTHTGERPYKCSECDKSYRRKDYLLNHQRRHSGEGLFQCPLCRKRFVLRRSFLKHQESHVQETHLALGGWPCTEIRGSIMHSI